MSDIEDHSKLCLKQLIIHLMVLMIFASPAFPYPMTNSAMVIVAVKDTPPSIKRPPVAPALVDIPKPTPTASNVFHVAT